MYRIRGMLVAQVALCHLFEINKVGYTGRRLHVYERTSLHGVCLGTIDH